MSKFKNGPKSEAIRQQRESAATARAQALAERAKMPRSACPVCGQQIIVESDGRFEFHPTMPMLRNVCVGSKHNA